MTRLTDAQLAALLDRLENDREWHSADCDCGGTDADCEND